MKTLFIPAKLKLEINNSKILPISNKLPKNIAIAYSVQYENYAKEIKNFLQKNHKIIKFVQVLGCSKLKFPKNTKAILLISDGKFHAISLACETELPVYLLENNQLIKISEKDVENLKKKQKGAYIKFLNAKKMGILVSTKPGQQNLKKALEIKNKIKNKETYLFISNNINTTEFDNFPEIESWVNTACPRLDMEDARIINMSRIE